jgi:hypothetical protein
MIYMHIMAAILAVWRITELFTQDRITAKLREKFPTYLWQCPRCMSVWAGAWCTTMFALGPLTHDFSRWTLWPFALAWFYLVRVEAVYAKRIAQEGRRLVIEARGSGWSLSRNDFSAPESQEILSRALSEMIRVQHPTQPPQPPSSMSSPAVRPNGAGGAS